MDNNLQALKNSALHKVAALSPAFLEEVQNKCHQCAGRTLCPLPGGVAYRAIWAFQEAADAAGVAYADVPGGELPVAQKPDLTVEQATARDMELVNRLYSLFSQTDSFQS